MSYYPSSINTASRHATKSGAWQPLPYIHSGFVVYPYQPSPSSPATPSIPQRSSSLHDGLEPRSATGGSEKARLNPYEVPLDIGDEFFAFEEYRTVSEVGGKEDIWYRGYVVQAVSLPSLATLLHSTNYVSNSNPEPSVLIGIFPSSCVHVRPESSVDDGSLGNAFKAAIKKAQENEAKARAQGSGWGDEMHIVKEEDEDEDRKVGSPRSLHYNPDPSDGEMVIDITSTGTVENKRNSIGATTGRKKRPQSLILEPLSSDMDQKREEEKDQPPLPRLTAGDSTIAGQSSPLIDEIACAIREWYTRLPSYLANREYRLFNVVTQHIDALLLGRRQLLSQTLSVDELVKVKRECVSRLVKCNVAQGLDVIVRSLEDGSVMVVEKERAYAGASWIGGIACYVYQIQLAYIDLIPLDTLLGKSSTLLPPVGMPTQISQNRTNRPLTMFSTNDAVNSAEERSAYHLLLDVHAFVANPCRPGETAELFFSLYSAVENRFITEEYCIVLNHLGSPARDSERRLGRLRTLFTDLKVDELGSSVYLVCKLVRNGALKMKNDTASGTLDLVSRQNGISTRHLGASHSQMGTLLSSPSVAESVTDDSFSITSGFNGHRTTTVETSLTTTPSTMDGRPTYRRPLGYAAVPLPQLTKLLAEGNGAEITMRIYAPRDEANFATLYEDIIRSRNKELSISSRTESIAISLKAFNGPVQQVIREHPSSLHGIPLSSRLGFSDVVYPGEYRNDIYVQIWAASFSTSPVSNGGSIRVRKGVIPTNNGNVQVTAEVRRQDGTIVTDAIFSGGSGEPSVAYHHSLVYLQNDKPTYGETLKISLPVQAEDCHVFLTFRSRGKDKTALQDSHELERPFAFAYLPLIRESVCIKDGTHDLVLYRMEKSLQPAPHIYFEAPAFDTSEDIATSALRSLTPLRDRISVKTSLCSSVHTQNDTLRSLFRWQGNLTDTEDITSMLRLLSFVDEEEISHFVPRVFDSLFGIMISNLGERQDEMDDMVFAALTKVLAMSTDRRYPGFIPVFDNYLSRQFNYPASGFRLLRSMKAVMSRPDSKDYRSFIKVWHLFFRFIVRSRELDRARGIGLDATSKHIEADFQRQTKAILGEINTLMESNDKALIGTQTLAVQHYADILPGLSQVFGPLEIAELVIAFADTLTFAKGSIAVYKLLLLLQVIKSVFDTTEARALLVPAIVRWVKPHLGRYDPGFAMQAENLDAVDLRKVKWMECNRLAITVVAWTVNKLQEWYSSDLILEDRSLRSQEEENLEYCLTLLPSLLESYAELSSLSTAETLSRHRSTPATVYKLTPDVFPMSLPFALISELPPPSLLEKQAIAEDGLPVSKTFVCGAVEVTVVIFTLVLSAPRQNVMRWLNELYDIEGPVTTSSILQSVFSFCDSVVKNESYPAHWLTLNLMSLGSIIRLLDPISELLQKSFVPSSEDVSLFDIPLWKSLFELLCDFCSNNELALEDMRQQRRRAQWVISGDLRDDGAVLLSRLWSALGWEEGKDMQGIRYGGYQTRFTGLAGRILSLCLSSHDGLCETAVEILFSMIYAEYVLNGQFESIQSEIFAKLDELFSNTATTNTSSLSDPASRAYFVAQLRTVFENSPPIDEGFQRKVGDFMTEIELFINLLFSLRDIPEDSQWRDERSSALYRLLSFSQKMGRTDLYVRFVHQLRQSSLGANDHLAAGHALRLHAGVNPWADGESLDEFEEMGLPPQTQFERKEALLYHALDHFVEAEAYETAIEICQELIEQYQTQTFEISKLSEMLIHQAKLWGKVGTSGRPKPEYFRVAYFGDVSLVDRGKDFVVRGQPWERYSDFCEKIQLKFPSAMIHRSKISPSEAIRQGSEPVIWITSLSPEPDLSRPVFRDKVAENIQAYWRFNDVKTFSSVRPYTRDQGDVQSVLSWTEKTVLTTAESLPGVLCRSEVVEITYEQISPVSNALLEVNKASKTLRSMSSGEVDVKQLGTAINGAVDSPVNGGVKLYRSTFLDCDYAARHPDQAFQVRQLQYALDEYVKMISEALSVHQALCRDVAFHEALRSHFRRAFPDEIQNLPKHYDQAILDAPLPPLPTMETRLSIPMLDHRTSSFSMGSTAYVLPALRLGPSIDPSPASSIKNLNMTITPSPSVTRDVTTVSNTARSSPRQSVLSRGSRVTASPPSIVLNNGITSNLSNGQEREKESRPSLSTRALSVVGSMRSANGRRSRESILVEDGGEILPSIRRNGEGVETRSEGDLVEKNKGTGSRKGLKRLSGFIKR